VTWFPIIHLQEEQLYLKLIKENLMTAAPEAAAASFFFCGPIGIMSEAK
jgi:hypothetical protein